MAAPGSVRNPQAVLFACAMNAVRSPMAESLLQQMFPKTLYVRSAGVKKGELDPFAVAVMAELGQDISRHRPKTWGCEYCRHPACWGVCGQAPSGEGQIQFRRHKEVGSRMGA